MDKLKIEAKRKAVEKWRKANPWRRAYDNAKHRCKPNMPYGRRGIKFNLVNQEVKTLWFRDGADLMKFPSIDRIDGKGDYVFNNCRFIEMALNRNPKSVVMFRIFNSLADAARVMKCSSQHIGSVTNGDMFISHGKKYRKRSFRGFTWKFLKDFPKAIVEAQKEKENKRIQTHGR